MQVSWPTLACPSSSGSSFWSHEWEKHGTCSESILNQHGYFQAALNHKDKVDLLQILESAGRSSSRSSRPAARAPASNTHKPAAAAPPRPVPAQGQSGSVMGSLGATIADGLAWGTGTSIAHRAMDALMGPRVIKHETVASSASDVPPAPNTNGVGSSTVCADQSKALIDCLEGYGSDISKCQFYMDMLHQCRQNSGTLSA